MSLPSCTTSIPVHSSKRARDCSKRSPSVPVRAVAILTEPLAPSLGAYLARTSQELRSELWSCGLLQAVRPVPVSARTAVSASARKA